MDINSLSNTRCDVDIPKRLKSPDSSLFLVEVCTFPTKQIQSLTRAYMGQQGRLIVFHDVDHQIHAKPESGDEHIPL